MTIRSRASSITGGFQRYPSLYAERTGINYGEPRLHLVRSENAVVVHRKRNTLDLSSNRNYFHGFSLLQIEDRHSARADVGCVRSAAVAFDRKRGARCPDSWRCDSSL